MSSYRYVLKFIIVGDTSTGKSCLLLRFKDDKFTLDHDITIGVEFGSKILFGDTENGVKIQAWDCAGQEVFRSITRSYYRGCAGVLLVYDLTRRETFEHILTWLADVEKHCDAERRPVIALVGNKSDLEHKRQVSTEEGQEFARRYNLLFFETSARDGNGVNDLFTDIAKEILKTCHTLPGPPHALTNHGGIRLHNMEEDNDVWKNSCCQIL